MLPFDKSFELPKNYLFVFHIGRYVIFISLLVMQCVMQSAAACEYIYGNV